MYARETVENKESVQRKIRYPLSFRRNLVESKNVKTTWKEKKEEKEQRREDYLEKYCFVMQKINLAIYCVAGERVNDLYKYADVILTLRTYLRLLQWNM